MFGWLGLFGCSPPVLTNFPMLKIFEVGFWFNPYKVFWDSDFLSLKREQFGLSLFEHGIFLYLSGLLPRLLHEIP